jgi:hypothetical protein
MKKELRLALFKAKTLSLSILALLVISTSTAEIAEKPIAKI